MKQTVALLAAVTLSASHSLRAEEQATARALAPVGAEHTLQGHSRAYWGSLIGNALEHGGGI